MGPVESTSIQTQELEVRREKVILLVITTTREFPNLQAPDLISRKDIAFQFAPLSEPDDSEVSPHPA
jgi:hypothetical protein